MELEICQLSESRCPKDVVLKTVANWAMLREVTEIESIGDSCYNLASYHQSQASDQSGVHRKAI